MRLSVNSLIECVQEAALSIVRSVRCELENRDQLLLIFSPIFSIA